MRTATGLDALDAVRSIEALDDGRHRVVVDDGGAAVGFVVTIERTDSVAPTPLTCKGAEGLGYPAFRLVALERVA